MSTIQTLISRGTAAAQPAASSVSAGSIYFQTDTGLIQRSNGTTWDTFSAIVFTGDSGAGGTTGLVSAPPSGSAAAGKFLKADATWAVPSGSSGALTQIAQVITAASQATVDFNTIAGTFNSLLVVYEAQDTQAGTSNVGVSLKINNDGTAANYTSTFRIGAQNATAFASSIAASTSGVQIGGIPQSGNTNISGGGRILIPSYARTVFHKRIFMENAFDEATNNGTTMMENARWKSTAAITRLTFIAGGTAFTNGSVFTLYGLN